MWVYWVETGSSNCHLLLQVCLGFVQNFDDKGIAQVVTPEYVTTGQYEVDIAGIRYAAKVNLHSPNLPTRYPDKERLAYRATRDSVVSTRVNWTGKVVSNRSVMECWGKSVSIVGIIVL